MITYGCHLHHGIMTSLPLYFGLEGGWGLYASIMPRGHWKIKVAEAVRRDIEASSALPLRRKVYHGGLDKCRASVQEWSTNDVKTICFHGRKAHKERSITALITLWSAAQDWQEIPPFSSRRTGRNILRLNACSSIQLRNTTPTNYCCSFLTLKNLEERQKHTVGEKSGLFRMSRYEFSFPKGTV